MSTPTKITFPPRIPFSQCDQSLNGKWTSCDSSKQTNNFYEGEFSYDPSGEYSATFSSPSVKDCEQAALLNSTCNIVLRFKDNDLEIIKSLVPDLPEPPKAKPNVQTPLNPKQYNGLSTATCFDPVDCGVEFIVDKSPYIIGIILVLGAATLFVGPLKRSIFGNNDTRSSSKRRRSAPRTSMRGDGNATQNQEPANFNTHSQDLSSIYNQLRSIANRLDKLENRIFALESDSTSSSVRGFTRTPASPETQVAATTPVPVESISPPLPLSEDLIKQAVSKPDYSLLQSYPHLFLNETQDSRQGKLESRCFDVVGDHTESSSHANAEFIAITFNSRTYLIPNILPNAADPRRTLKRHVDANSIYRAGSGSNILKIDILAEVEKTTAATYELTKTGQVN